LEIVIQENVAGFYISMNDAHMELRVQIGEPFSRAEDYIKSLLPSEGSSFFTCSQVKIQLKFQSSKKL
jgi:hypothetical protein